jgi:glycine/D-amino acid oxidase-like deaminating enzyme
VITPQPHRDGHGAALHQHLGPVLAEKVGVTIPLLACEHQYAITIPLLGLAGETREVVHPILRHQDHAMYFRQHFDRYGIGSYQHEPLLVDPRQLGRKAMHEFTPEHFIPAWNSTTELFPPIAKTQLTTKFNGMFSFTIDGMPVLGEAQHVKGFWTAVAIWVTHPAGGQAIAEWLTNGVTELDLREADVNRCAHARSKSYIMIAAQAV